MGGENGQSAKFLTDLLLLLTPEAKRETTQQLELELVPYISAAPKLLHDAHWRPRLVARKKSWNGILSAKKWQNFTLFSFRFFSRVRSAIRQDFFERYLSLFSSP